MSGTTTEAPAGKLSGFLLWLGIVAAIGLLLFFRYYLAALADGVDVPFLKPFITEMTGAFGGGLLFFPVRWLTRRHPLDRLRRLPGYLGAMLLVSAAHTSLNWAFRAALFPLAGFGAYDYGIIPLRYAMELPGDVVVFWIMVVALYGAGRLRAAREQQVRTARLQSSLARAELRNLRLRSALTGPSASGASAITASCCCAKAGARRRSPRVESPGRHRRIRSDMPDRGDLSVRSSATLQTSRPGAAILLSMALPVPREPEHDEQALEECVFRPVLKPDGRWVIEQLPLTLDVLLNPQEDDQVPQSNPHARMLTPLFDVLRRYLERQPNLSVFSDLLIYWGIAGLRQVSPDVSVVEGLADREAVKGSLDLGEERQARVRLVIEVVSTDSKLQRDKDEKHNPDVFRRAGVDDYVLVYPPDPDESDRPRLRLLTLGRSGRYRESRPDRRGRLLLRSVNLHIGVDDEGQLMLEDVATGDRLLTAEQGEAARYRTEIRLASEKAARREAQARAESEAAARREAEARAESEAARAEKAETELARLREEMARRKS